MADSEYDDLVQRVTKAQGAADIVHDLWCLAVHVYGNPGNHQAPTLDALATWLAACRWSLPTDTALFKELAKWDYWADDIGGMLAASTEKLHEKWLRIDEDGIAHPKGHHPLAPMMRRWLARATPGKPFRPVRRASLPSMHKTGGNPLLPNTFPMDDPPDRHLHFDIPPITVESDPWIHWLLWAYDQAGGVSMQQGRGAPWALRLFIGALLHVPVENRDGRFHTYRYPVHPDPDWPDVPALIDWIFPGGRRWKSRKRDWCKLPRALHAIKRDMAYAPVTAHDGERYSMSLIAPTVIPESPGANLVEFMIRLPGGGGGGVRLDWTVLSEYGTEGAVIYRAYMSAMAHLDRSAHHGHPITQVIKAPILGVDGKPIRYRGGRVARSKTETVPNPSARYVRAMTDADLTRMIGLDPTNRQRRKKAREAFERLDADGHIALVRSGGKLQIFGPNQRD